VTDPTRGVLYPERLPRLQRFAPRSADSDLVAWYWVPEWDLPHGVVSRQQVLAYPAANLVVEASGVTLWGPTTRVSERVLEGSGWAVGALLKPAAFSRLTGDPAALVDTFCAFDDDTLRGRVGEVMPGGGADAAARMGQWLDARIGERTGETRLANAAADLLMTDAAILRVEDAAARLAVSIRTLQRLTHRTVGLSPAAMIRRRRLQEAAQRLRDDSALRLAEVAADLGYADQSHLANDFRAVLGVTPSAYRAESPPP
jgi:AraC-like DNA-binding protein